MTNIAITIAIENCIWNCIGFFADIIRWAALLQGPFYLKPNYIQVCCFKEEGALKMRYCYY